MNKPLKSPDVPVTEKMLGETRNELKHDLSSFRLEVRSQFKGVNARFKEVDARFNEVDARFNEVDARFDRMDERFDRLESKFDSVLSRVNRNQVLSEEQEARNKYVLDGYTSLYDRQERVEIDFKNLLENYYKIGKS